MRDHHAGEHDLHRVARLERHHLLRHGGGARLAPRQGVTRPVAQGLDALSHHVLGHGGWSGMRENGHGRTPTR